MNQSSFIDPGLINRLMEKAGEPVLLEVKQIIAKAKKLKGLDLEDAAKLLNINDRRSLELLFEAALWIKEQIYGSRLVLFAPLYVSSYCSNNCLYCGFRKDNPDIHRKCLTLEEIKKETEMILSQGHKRILMLMGEHPSECTFDYFLQAIDAAYSAKDAKGSSLRRINVEIAPLTDDEFRRLSKVKIGTYTVFQETYNPKTYKQMHPSGMKSDYAWRLYSMDRALKNGLHDVGIGALFGLYDYRFEVLSLLVHAKHLDETYGVGPHTISIPRIEPASNAPASRDIPFPVSDPDFLKIVAILRCAVPYTGIILSTRESPDMRAKLFDLGVSQISAGSKTDPGGYSDVHAEEGQFSVNDTRSAGEVISSVIEQGYVPSFCTGCYRRGRVGADFMDLAKPGLIKLHCLPNALSTLQEYLIDYADEKTRMAGERLIAEQLKRIPQKKRKEDTMAYLERIKNGERDLYF